MPRTGPAKGVTREIAFASAPHPAENDKVAVHLPATFDPGKPVTLCLFLHGMGGDVSFEDHIEKAIDQIATCSANVALVAPRFGAGVQPGCFEDGDGFSSFIAELESKLPAMAGAPIVLVAFSGGWRPLGAILTGLLDQTGPLADRVTGLLLLDSLYGPLSSAAIVAWQKVRRAQTALLSIYGRYTAQNAPAANRTLIETLRETGPVITPASSSELAGCSRGTVTFIEAATPHLDIVSEGAPIAAFLEALAP